MDLYLSRLFNFFRGGRDSLPRTLTLDAVLLLSRWHLQGRRLSAPRLLGGKQSLREQRERQKGLRMAPLAFPATSPLCAAPLPPSRVQSCGTLSHHWHWTWGWIGAGAAPYLHPVLLSSSAISASLSLLSFTSCFFSLHNAKVNNEH